MILLIAKKKIIALVLSVVAICSLAGCGNKEDTKTEQPNNEVVSQETEKEQTENNSIIGTWVIEKYEVYDGPIKRQCEEMCKEWYYSGAEYEFTQNEFKSVIDEKLTTKYKILNDKEMEILTLANEALIYDYELTGDSLVLHSNYTGSLANMGYCMSLYLNRK